MSDDDKPLTPVELIRLAADQAVRDALEGDCGALGDLWASREELTGRAKAAKDFATKLLANAKAGELEAEQIGQAIMEAMDARDLDKIDCGYGLIKTKLAGGNQAVTVTGVVPKEYQTEKTEVKNNLKLIGDKLRAGDILAFACLEPRGKSLTLEVS